MAITTRIAAPRTQAHGIQFSLSNQSIARVMQQIRVMQPISRAELVKTLGYSQPSVTRYVNTLIDAGLVRTQLEHCRDIRAGRPAEQLVIDGQNLVAWGIHIGARTTELAITDGGGRVVRSQLIDLHIVEHSASDALGRMCQEIHKLARGLSGPVTIGVAFSEHVASAGTITSSVYGWDNVAAGDIIADILGRSVWIASGVSAMAGAELAYAPLDDGPLRINPQENESTLYFYAREVIAHAWIFHGAVHRPHRGVPPQAFARIAQSGTFTAQEGVHPLGNAAVVGAARQRRIPAKNLSHLVEIAQCNRTARRLLDERAELLGRIIQLAIDVVDPKTVVFAGDAFTADPAGVQLIAKQLRQDSHGLSDLRIQRAGKSIVQDAARVVATYQLWQDPIGTLS